MSQYFYCYSKKLSFFIRAFGIKYVDKGFNAKSSTRYYIFEKSEKLDRVIELYNRVKHTV